MTESAEVEKKLREKFEAWVSAHTSWSLRTIQEMPGSYSQGTTLAAWIVWRAAYDLGRQDERDAWVRGVKVMNGGKSNG